MAWGARNLISTQVRAADVGVVTPYAAQARLVREKVDAAVEVASVDAFQGRCLLYTSPSPRDRQKSRMPSSA